jgi:hypothetical protein
MTAEKNHYKRAVGAVHAFMTHWASESRATVSDDKGKWDDIRECPNCDHQGIPGLFTSPSECAIFGERESKRLLGVCKNEQQRRVWHLVRVGKAGNELPEVGQVCLVLQGDKCKDVGQECAIVKQSTARVQVAFKDKHGRQATKLKHPASLVLLKDGLHIVQDARCWVWVK